MDDFDKRRKILNPTFRSGGNYPFFFLEDKGQVEAIVISRIMKITLQVRYSKVHRDHFIIARPVSFLGRWGYIPNRWSGFDYQGLKR